MKPTFHSREDGGSQLNFTRDQLRLSISEPNKQQRVKGVVGSGKTTVLASRAVNAHKRHEKKVLILCFNITLKNYIHDKISKVREEFNWISFYINNYHNFITTEMNNCGIEFNLPKGFDNLTQDEKSEFFETNYFSNLNLFQHHKDQLNKYDTILIDEIQDYKYQWMEMVKTNFLAPGGEYVIWGDEKQNIYANELESKDLKTNVIGQPNRLNDCFRSVDKIKEIAVKYQRQNFGDRYNLDDFDKRSPQTRIDYSGPSSIKYHFYEGDRTMNIQGLYDLVKQYTVELDEHPNDITVLGFRVDVLREFECYYRYTSSERTNLMFETQEIWYKLFLQTFKKYEVIAKGVSTIKANANVDKKKNLLSILLAIRDLIRETKNPLFTKRLTQYLDKYQVSRDDFDQWYNDNELKDLLNTDKKYSLRQLEYKYREYRTLTKQLKKVRDNKKFHFWYDRGTVKISTVHSFKGWEANTLFLILEEDYEEYGDFLKSFEELIYTALTRSKSNLIVLNYGNEKHHKSMMELFDLN